jgi:hypothetical protein
MLRVIIRVPATALAILPHRLSKARSLNLPLPGLARRLFSEK